MVLNEFDAYVEALKKVNLNEEVAPIYKGRLLTENVDIYCKIQKLLGCPAMEQCHRYLYDLDVENLDESECSKVNNLFKLGVEKGYLEDEDAEKTEECDILPPEAGEEADKAMEVPVDKVPAQVVAQEPVKPEAPAAAYTVLYSATRDGQIKTGEAYSNSLNTRSAKADVINQLEKAGYLNISILAIEAGDPDLQGCDNTFCKQSDYVPPAYEDEEENVEEADMREPLAHAFHPIGLNASTANTIGQDAVEMTITEDEAKAEVKKAFDSADKEVGDSTDAAEIKKILDDNKEDFEKLKDKLEDEKAKKNLDKVLKLVNDYAEGKVQEDEELDEAGKKPSSGVGTVVRGLVKILLTLTKLAFKGVGLSGKLVVWATDLLAKGADKINMQLKDSEDENQVNEDGEDEEKSDDSAESDDGKEEDAEEKEDSSDAADDGSADDDKEDKEDDKKEEDAEEPDEKLKDDKKEEDGKEDATDDKEEEELSAQEKILLKDSYKKAFKAAMQKCKYFDKSFDDLTLEEKVEFFETINDAWGNKADPSKFMSDKETELLQKIVVKK